MCVAYYISLAIEISIILSIWLTFVERHRSHTEGEYEKRKKFHDLSNSALKYLCFQCDANFESTTNIH